MLYETVGILRRESCCVGLVCSIVHETRTDYLCCVGKGNKCHKLHALMCMYVQVRHTMHVRLRVAMGAGTDRTVGNGLKTPCYAGMGVENDSTGTTLYVERLTAQGCMIQLDSFQGRREGIASRKQIKKQKHTITVTNLPNDSAR